MANDLANFYKARMAAERSAFIATPAVYRLADSAMMAADSFESSASIHFEQPMNETDILNLGANLAVPNEILKNQIMQVLLSDQHIQDPVAKQAFAKQKEAQVKAIIEAYTKRVEQKMKIIAEMKAFNKHETAKTEQAQRLYGTDLSASQELSEEKNDSITEIENAYLMGPDDIAVA
jgi:hypothetical protein